jgi:hypothetical protein
MLANQGDHSVTNIFVLHNYNSRLTYFTWQMGGWPILIMFMVDKCQMIFGGGRAHKQSSYVSSWLNCLQNFVKHLINLDGWSKKGCFEQK